MEYQGFALEIIQDQECESPREGDVFGTLVCWHSRYTIGEKHHHQDPEDFFRDLAREHLDDQSSARMDDLEDSQERSRRFSAIAEKHYLILPVYLYSHSGESLSVRPFSCPWDSGRVGFIYVSKADALKELGGKRLSAKKVARAQAILTAEIAHYNDWRNGDCYGYVIHSLRPLTEEAIAEGYAVALKDRFEQALDACFGYIGEAYTDDAYVIQEAKSVVDHYLSKKCA